jgi:hypothetical protein
MNTLRRVDLSEIRDCSQRKHLGSDVKPFVE